MRRITNVKIETRKDKKTQKVRVPVFSRFLF